MLYVEVVGVGGFTTLLCFPYFGICYILLVFFYLSASSKTEPKYEKRNFTYTRQQWTGKSPKQFLIDWIRKNLPKSPPPSYKHIKVCGNLWKCRSEL